ncbi:2Fe-2S iron-sulfur cluster-binding protein [Marinobacterium sp. YM272]|uniref:2Fe-2S iron-sulfur cluster-binding protein n=1 Tax=Marinobacterium sp. YM272 TaxID=3421654 RepID=UPI003D7F5BF4
MTQRRLWIEGFTAPVIANPADSLLEALSDAGYPVRSSCRNGNCEICEAALLQGAVRQTYPQLHLLGDYDAPPIIRLCTSFAQSDLRLRLMPYALRKSARG